MCQVDEVATLAFMRLLVVEDHLDSANALSRLLSLEGHAVDVGRDVRSALELCEHNIYDILLADIGLPDGTGWELMKAVNHRGLLRGIAISGHAYDADIKKSMEAGFSEHLVKPILMDRLMAAIDRVASLPPRTLAGSDCPQPGGIANWDEYHFGG